MLGCVVIAFALCNPNYAYAQGGYYAPPPPAYYAPAPQAYYPAPTYIVAPPVYYAQPYYGPRYPGLGIHVGRHGGVGVVVR